MRGKVEPFNVRRILDEDHPRVCGEKQKGTEEQCKHTGSPPRMRGKGKHRNVLDRRHGITPAYAGKRLKRSHRCVASAIILHPVHSVCNRPAAPDGSPAGRGALLYLPAGNAAPMPEVCSLVLGKACGGPAASGRCSGWLGRGAPAVGRLPGETPYQTKCYARRAGHSR